MTVAQQNLHDAWDVIWQDQFNNPGSTAGTDMDAELIAHGFPQMGQTLVDYFNDWISHITPTDFIELIKWVWKRIRELAEWLWNKLND